jgi:hypothetical protein
MAIWGPIALAVGTGEALWLAAGLILAANAVMLAVPSVRALRDEPERFVQAA